jgi:hypothetical protein
LGTHFNPVFSDIRFPHHWKPYQVGGTANIGNLDSRLLHCPMDVRNVSIGILQEPHELSRAELF